MAHKHSVYDTEPHFQIDKTSREIKNVSATKTTITQFDHNSERFTFEIPRFIDGHDMSLCNKVQVHYINIDSTDKTNKIIGVYTVEDLQLSPEDENIVICSWLISQNATQLAGSLVFLLRFACVTDEVLDYAWNTARCTTISVSNGLYNGEALIEEYFDILSVWEQNIIDDVTVGIDQTIEEKVDNIKLVETATGNTITIDSSEAPIPYMKLSGKTTQDGTPTLDAPVPSLVSVGDSGSFEVGVYGKNSFDITTLYPRSSTQGGTVSFDGDKANISSKNQGWAILYSTPIIVEVGENYIFQCKISNYSATTNTFVYIDYGNGVQYPIKITGDGYYQQDFYAPTNTIIIKVCSNATTTGVLNTFTLSEAQLELGTTATPYEPCNKQTLTMPYTLRSVGDIKDEVDFARGVRIPRVAKFVVNGSEEWVLNSGNRCFRIIPSNYGITPKRALGLCSHFEQGMDKDLCFFVSGGANAISIYDYNNKWADLNAFKTWLSENNVTFVLPLETPIETALTETELNAYRQLMTNKGTTTILSESDMEILYYVNKPNAQVIGNIHTQINKDYLKLHAMLQAESQSEG